MTKVAQPNRGASMDKLISKVRRDDVSATNLGPDMMLLGEMIERHGIGAVLTRIYHDRNHNKKGNDTPQGHIFLIHDEGHGGLHESIVAEWAEENQGLICLEPDSDKTEEQEAKAVKFLSDRGYEVFDPNRSIAEFLRGDGWYVVDAPSFEPWATGILRDIGYTVTKGRQDNVGITSTFLTMEVCAIYKNIMENGYDDPTHIISNVAKELDIQTEGWGHEDFSRGCFNSWADMIEALAKIVKYELKEQSRTPAEQIVECFLIDNFSNKFLKKFHYNIPTTNGLFGGFDDGVVEALDINRATEMAKEVIEEGFNKINDLLKANNLPVFGFSLDELTITEVGN